MPQPITVKVRIRKVDQRGDLRWKETKSVKRPYESLSRCFHEPIVKEKTFY